MDIKEKADYIKEHLQYDREKLSITATISSGGSSVLLNIKNKHNLQEYNALISNADSIILSDDDKAPFIKDFNLVSNFENEINIIKNRFLFLLAFFNADQKFLSFNNKGRFDFDNIDDLTNFMVVKTHLNIKINKKKNIIETYINVSCKYKNKNYSGQNLDVINKILYTNVAKKLEKSVDEIVFADRYLLEMVNYG